MRRVRVIYPGGTPYMVALVDAESGAVLNDVLGFSFTADVGAMESPVTAWVRLMGHERMEQVEVVGLGPIQPPYLTVRRWYDA